MAALASLSDPEIVESLKYLLVPPIEKIKFQSQPFDGQKNFWLPDAKEGFVSCEVQSQKGDDVTVKTSKGEVKHDILNVLK